MCRVCGIKACGMKSAACRDRAKRTSCTSFATISTVSAMSDGSSTDITGNGRGSYVPSGSMLARPNDQRKGATSSARLPSSSTTTAFTAV